MAKMRSGFILFMSMMFLMSSLSYGYMFKVGGKDGWAVKPSAGFAKWAHSIRFQIHDSLYFKYDKAYDSVLVVNEKDYHSCNTKNPIKKLEGGESIVNLDRSGAFYFISGNVENCGKGEKLSVVVLSPRGGHKGHGPSTSPWVAPVHSPAPSWEAPAPGYKAPSPSAPGWKAPSPAPAWKAPAPGWTAPAPAYKAPGPSPAWKAPAPGWTAPAPGWKAPSPSWTAPAPEWKAPSPNASAPGWKAPAPSTPTPSWSAPSPRSSAPAPSAPGWTSPAPSPDWTAPAPTPSAPGWTSPAPSPDSTAPAPSVPEWKAPAPSQWNAPAPSPRSSGSTNLSVSHGVIVAVALVLVSFMF